MLVSQGTRFKMYLLQFVWFLGNFLACFCTNYSAMSPRKVDFCDKQGKDPYFDIDLVVGKKWKTYYTWNMKFDKECNESVFKKPTKVTIERIRSDMKDYLEQQPRWESAELHAVFRLHSSEHEALLFADQGPAGRFLAVPNIVRSPDNFPLSKGVPLIKIFLKLVANGRYLLMMDCVVGVASLVASDQPYHAEVASQAAALDVDGPSYPACTREKHKNELMSA